MASITIRLDDATEERLRIRAATHGHSMEEEAREILNRALGCQSGATPNLADSLRARFAPPGGIELPAIAREPMREPPDFGA